MAKRGRKVVFHGAFKTKARAVKKEHQLKHAYVRKAKVGKQTRYLVLTRRRRAR